jgi:sugar phosphate isomerase/epimerase
MGEARRSMRLGIFSKTFPRPDVDQVFAAVRDAGVAAAGFNLTCAGLEDMPLEIPGETIARIREAAARHGVALDCVSGTFNMAHPDPAVRADGLRRFAAVARATRPLGGTMLNLCTGTRDTGHMWHWHEGNDDPSAWRDMAASIAAALEIAEEADVDLLVEPETGNVVNSPQRAKRLLEEMGSARLKIIVDVANMTDPGDEDRLPAALDATFDLLAGDFAMVHGKDRTAAGRVVPAGQGIVPWERLLVRLDDIGFTGPFIIHGVDEAGAADAIGHFRSLGIVN